MTIKLAGHPMPGENNGAFMERIRRTLVHEMIHYTQYRDHKTVWEAGVGLATNNLYRSMFSKDC